MSYDQGSQGSRRNFNEDSNYDSPQRTLSEGDSALSGSYGGSGTGQAGGYTGNESRVGQQGQQDLDKGDEYCDTDPGMAGNRSIQGVNAPGAGHIGGEYDSAYGQSISGDGRSRGYERDVDEYDDSGIGSGQGHGAGASAGRGQTSKLSSMGSKLKGGVEKMADKLSNDPSHEN